MYNCCSVYNPPSSSGSSGPTGSGTLNYVAKWTPSGTALGDSQIYDNATSVGVGTNTPATYFSVVKAQNAATVVSVYNTTAGTGSRVGYYASSDVNNLAFQAYSSTNSNTYLQNNVLLYGGANALRIVADADGLGSGSITFGIGGVSSVANQKATILSTGEFGLNVAAPTALFDAVGLGSSSGTLGLRLSNSSGVSSFIVNDSSQIMMGKNLSTPLASVHIKGNSADVSGVIFLVNSDASLSSELFAIDYTRDVRFASRSFLIKDNTGTTQGSATFEVVNDNPVYIARFGCTTTPQALTVHFQGKIGMNTASVDGSAQLQIDSTSRGFAPPRMTTTQKNAIGTPLSGIIVYDTTLGKLCVYGAAAWETITSV